MTQEELAQSVLEGDDLVLPLDFSESSVFTDNGSGVSTDERSGVSTDESPADPVSDSQSKLIDSASPKKRRPRRKGRGEEKCNGMKSSEEISTSTDDSAALSPRDDVKQDVICEKDFSKDGKVSNSSNEIENKGLTESTSSLKLSGSQGHIRKSELRRMKGYEENKVESCTGSSVESSVYQVNSSDVVNSTDTVLESSSLKSFDLKPENKTSIRCDLDTESESSQKYENESKNNFRFDSSENRNNSNQIEDKNNNSNADEDLKDESKVRLLDNIELIDSLDTTNKDESLDLDCIQDGIPDSIDLNDLDVQIQSGYPRGEVESCASSVTTDVSASIYSYQSSSSSILPNEDSSVKDVNVKPSALKVSSNVRPVLPPKPKSSDPSCSVSSQRKTWQDQQQERLSSVHDRQAIDWDEYK